MSSNIRFVLAMTILWLFCTVGAFITAYLLVGGIVPALVATLYIFILFFFGNLFGFLFCWAID